MAPSDVRPAAVAGQFYPGEPDQLQKMVDTFLGEVAADPEEAPAAIVPHAGLIYSGRCAAQVFKRLTIPPIVVILAPNHTGRLGAGGGASVWAHGAFETPLGRVPIASALAERLCAECELAAHDPEAHVREHAVEVELPFLQTLAPDTAIVPIVLAWDDWTRCRALAHALAHVVHDQAERVLVLASSDMTHYESAARAAAKDRRALAAVEHLDGENLLRICRHEDVTMCGRAPAAVAVETARIGGAAGARVVDYRHSGWVTGDDASVVAYAGVLAN